MSFIAVAKKFIKSEDAPTMVEYAMLVSLIALVAYAGAATLGKNLSTMFTAFGGSV